VDVGQTVSASTSAPTLFVIANDLARMRVEANIDEADIGLLGQNKRVDFTVDAYPNDTFLGRIDEIRLNASTTQNVVTYGVIVTFDNPDMKLKPGMTAYLSITVAEREDALSVPNAALRYDPPADVLAEGRKRGAAAGSNPERIEAMPPPLGSALSETDPGEGLDGGDSNSGSLIAVPATTTVFMPGQLWDTGEMLQFEAAAEEPPRPGRVWVMTDSGVPEMREVMVGITDESRTEVVSGDLAEGEVVVISDSLTPAEETPQSGGGRGGFIFGR
jgi:HlyD family secretion protein